MGRPRLSVTPQFLDDLVRGKPAPIVTARSSQAVRPGQAFEVDLVVGSKVVGQGRAEVVSSNGGSIHVRVTSARKITTERTPPPIPARAKTPRPVTAAVAPRPLRTLLEVSVDLVSEHNFYTGLVQNISSGGLFIASAQVRRVGEKLRVRFSLPDHESAIEVEAEVRWTREVLDIPGHERGFGVRFLSLPAGAEKAINRFIGSREPLFFDFD